MRVGGREGGWEGGREGGKEVHVRRVGVRVGGREERGWEGVYYNYSRVKWLKGGIK